MELFAYKVRFNEQHEVDMQNGEAPDSTFDNFLYAFLSVFIVLANDGWSTIYIDHYLATSGVVASFFFVSLLIFGQYILLNLFLAILLQNFDEASITQNETKEVKKKVGVIGRLWIKIKLKFGPRKNKV